MRRRRRFEPGPRLLVAPPTAAVDATFRDLEAALARAKAQALRDALEHLANVEELGGLDDGTLRCLRELSARFRSEARELDRLAQIGSA